MVSSNQRIAKNTLLLYLRMFVTMIISLYTSRIVLQVLGVDDFGIYNVVGGLIVLFSFLNGAMASATQRFLNVELGKGDITCVKRVFSMSMTCYIIIILIIIFLAETVGLWFLEKQMNIPADRIHAAFWVYQLSLLTFCVNILKVPYNASIIAFEKMSFYAYISIIEAGLKLVIVWLLLISSFDKLISYTFLILLISIIVFIVYKFYCNQKFEVCSYYFFWDVNLCKSLLGFSAWSLFGSLSNLLSSQGINLLLNIFCGVAMNAAMGIANQVNAVVFNFVSNFQTAFSPQIMKLYSSNEKSRFMKLIFQTSKFSYYLMFILAVPVVLNMQYLLTLWLVDVPSYTVSFCQITIITFLIDAISGPLWMSIQATGNIRNYQIILGAISLLNLPISYCLLKLGADPVNVLVVRLVLNIAIFVVRLFLLKFYIYFPIRLYVKKVIWVSLKVSVLSIPIPIFIKILIEQNLLSLVFSSVCSFASVIICVYFIGLSVDERHYVQNLIFKYIIK